MKWMTGTAFLALGLPLVAACTGGVVVDGDRRIQDGDLALYTCDGKAFTASLAPSGEFRFNPYAPDTSAFDKSKMVPFGPLAVFARERGKPGVYWRAIQNHTYDQTCTNMHEGKLEQLPCERYIFDIHPGAVDSYYAPQDTNVLALSTDELGELAKFHAFCAQR